MINDDDDGDDDGDDDEWEGKSLLKKREPTFNIQSSYR